MKGHVAGPRLLTARLIRRNRAGPMRRRWIVMGCICVVALVLALSFLPALLAALDWLQHHILMASVSAAFVTAAIVARHRSAVQAEFAKSWVAALPARRGEARREAWQIELMPAAVGVAAVAGMMALVEIAFASGGHGGKAVALVVWLWLTGAIIVGTAASYAVPKPTVIDLPPGSRYVPKAPSKRGRTLRPSLSALGQWPVRQMFARAQPKLVARALMPVLLSIGLQSKADTVMVVVGLFAALGALALLIPSAITVSGSARRWLLPLPVLPGRLLRALLGRPLGVIVCFSAAAGLLLPLMEVSYTASVHAGAVLALGSIALVLLGVWRRFSVLMR